MHFEAILANALKSVHELHDKLVSQPRLTIPYTGGRCILYTNAYNFQVKCILLQGWSDGTTELCGYWSHPLTTVKQAYDTTQLECLAIVCSVFMYLPYLGGTRFMIWTDHDSLKWILKLAYAADRLARWRLRLSEFDFNVIEWARSKLQAKNVPFFLKKTGKDI